MTRFFVMVLMSFFLACAAHPSHSAKKSVESFPQQFFPLEVGKSWKYTYTGMGNKEVEIRVTDRKDRNGKTYFQLSQWFHLTPQPGPIWIAWKDGALYLDDGKGNEKKWIPGDPEDTVLTWKTESGKKTLIFRDCIPCRDAGSTFAFQENKGIVNTEFMAIWGAATYKLVETNATQENAR